LKAGDGDRTADFNLGKVALQIRIQEGSKRPMECNFEATDRESALEDRGSAAEARQSMPGDKSRKTAVFAPVTMRPPLSGR